MEEFERGQANGRGGFEKGEINEELVETNMVFKIKNCRKDDISLKNKRGRLRSKLEYLVGSKSQK